MKKKRIKDGLFSIYPAMNCAVEMGRRVQENSSTGKIAISIFAGLMNTLCLYLFALSSKNIMSKIR